MCISRSQKLEIAVCIHPMFSRDWGGGVGREEITFTCLWYLSFDSLVWTNENMFQALSYEYIVRAQKSSIAQACHGNN